MASMYVSYETPTDIMNLLQKIALGMWGVDRPVYLYPHEAAMIQWQFFCVQWTMLFSAVLYGKE